MLELAVRKHNERNFEEAERLYCQILADDGNNAVALEAYGVLLVQTARVTEGIDFLKRAVNASPTVAQRHFNLGQAFRLNDQIEQAMEAWQSAIRLDPNLLDAWNEIAQVSMGWKSWDEAKIALEHSLRLAPHQIERQCDLADVCFELSDFEAAKIRYQSLLASVPDHIRALNNCANIFKVEGCFAEAARFYERAIHCDPSHASLHFNLANVLIPLNLAERAFVAYQRALELNPQYVDALVGLGSLYSRTQNHSQSLACFERAYSLDPNNITVLENLIKAKQTLCIWEDLDRLEEKVLHLAMATETVHPSRVLSPFFALSRSKPTTPEQQLFIAKRYCERLQRMMRGPSARFQNIDPKVRLITSSNRRLRIGYLTADFRAHPVGMAMSQVIANHNRANFDVFAYSFGPNDGSPWRIQIEKEASRFVDMERWSIEASVNRVVEDRIDILIDLQGHIGDPRTEILIHRPAPIQAHYLGFPGTSGADFIDYDIVDEYVVPRDHRESFTEKMVYLPGCLLTSHAQAIEAGSTLDRASLGFLAGDFVFCAFHSVFKLNPTMADLWAKLLRETPRSILWLQEADVIAVENLQREFESRGIARERLRFAPRVSSSLHIARQKFADLFLDAFPYNAHTTACDTLRMNLPIVTLSGETIASRIAGSVLHSLDLDELITQTHDDYFQVAVRLATQPDVLKGIREKLSRSLAKTDLYDGLAFARKLEAAYQAMWQNYRQGDPRRHIDLTSPGS